jgi:hypothetical protein
LRECAPDDRLRRGTRYAAAYPLNDDCLWNTGSPLSRTMTTEYAAKAVLVPTTLDFIAQSVMVPPP